MQIRKLWVNQAALVSHIEFINLKSCYAHSKHKITMIIMKRKKWDLRSFGLKNTKFEETNKVFLENLP